MNIKKEVFQMFALALHMDDYPEVYALSLSKDFSRLTIRVNRKAAIFFGSYLKPNHPINLSFIKELGLEPFIPATEDKWGFGEIISTIEKSNTQIVWECKLPQRGEKSHPTRATLRQFFVYVDQFEDKVESPHPQYFSITDMQMRPGLDGSNMWVNVSPAFCRWMAAHQDDQNRIYSGVKEAMESAYAHLWKEPDRTDKASIKIGFQPPKGIWFQVPGNAYDLSSGSPPDDNLNCGYQMGIHNADYYFQQLTLLCGIAKIWQIVKNTTIV